jgi:hypothetical protein
MIYISHSLHYEYPKLKTYRDIKARKCLLTGLGTVPVEYYGLTVHYVHEAIAKPSHMEASALCQVLGNQSRFL